MLQRRRDRLLAALGNEPQKPCGSTATQVKTFKFRDGQIEKVEAAIDKVKRLTGETDESTALGLICRDFVDRETPITPDALAVAVADHLRIASMKTPPKHLGY